jgi:SAM-dependent methyltransferase
MKKNTTPQFCDINAKNCCSTSKTNDGIDLKSHWDNVYDNAEVNQLGWYEESPDPSLQLIQACALHKNAALLNVGAGATTLVDKLNELGYQNIIANDISPIALEKLKLRLGVEKEKVNWVVDDLTRPSALYTIGKVDLWHDRAVLHFFNEKENQDTYFDLLKKLVKPEGFVILATFNLNGAATCSGLPVHRYDKKMLTEKLGSSFELVEAFDYTYSMPSGDKREYVYALFKRK